MSQRRAPEGGAGLAAGRDDMAEERRGDRGRCVSDLGRGAVKRRAAITDATIGVWVGDHRRMTCSVVGSAPFER